MGNQVSSRQAFDDENIILRSGSIDNVLPIAGNFDSYESLILSNKYKESLLANLENDYLLESLIDSDANKDGTICLLGRLDCFQKNSEDEDLKIRKDFSNLNSCTLSGLDIKISEALKIMESCLNASCSIHSLPLLPAFQRRCIAIKSLLPGLLDDRKLVANMESRKTCTKKFLSSEFDPSIGPLAAINNFGIQMMKILPVLINQAISLKNIDIITEPLSLFRDALLKIKDLDLFVKNCENTEIPWAELTLSKDNLKCPGSKVDDLANMISSNPFISWNCNGGCLDITLNAPSDVFWLKISWIPVKNADRSALLEKFGAPERVEIFVNNHAEDTKNNSSFERVSTIFPAQEKQRQKSWIQHYKIDRKNVRKVRLLISRDCCKESSLKKSSIYELKLLHKDESLIHIDPLEMYHKLQNSLIPLLKFAELKPIVLGAIFSVLRSTGSLRLILEFCLNTYDDLEMSIMEKESRRLLGAIRENNAKLSEEYNKNYFESKEEIANAMFDENFVSSGLKIGRQGKEVVGGKEGGVCRINTSFENDGASFEIELLVDAIDKVKIGVVEASVELSQTESMGYLINCETGVLSCSNSIISHLVTKVRSGDTICLSYNKDTKLLSLSVNHEYKGVIFEQIPESISPVIIFDNFGESEEGEVTRRITLNRVVKVNSKSLIKSDKLKVIDPTQSDFEGRIQDILINEVAALSNVRLEYNQSTDDLYMPYCCEPSVDVIQLIHQLLTINFQAGRLTVVKALLDILNLQFSNIEQLKTSLRCIHDSFYIVSSDERWDARSNFINDLKDLINSIVATSTDELVKQSALQCYCTGVNCFYPMVRSRVEMIKIMVQDSTFNLLSSNDSQLASTSTLLETISTKKQVIEIFDLINSDEPSVHSLLSFLNSILHLCHTLEMCLLENTAFSQERQQLLKSSKASLSLFSEEIVYRLNEIDCSEVTKNQSQKLFLEVLVGFSKSCFSLASLYFQKAHSKVNDLKNDCIAEQRIDYLVKQSFIGTLVQPLLYCLSLHSLPQLDVAKFMPDFLDLLESGSLLSSYMNICSIAKSSMCLSIKRQASQGSELTSSTGKGGWKVIKAIFEEADSSYTISENGTRYTSVQSSNTCALLNVKFGAGQRAAWEFQLETDSIGDECSVFGIARRPLNSRCYSSSPDLWMRRSYNGYMYVQGSQNSGNNMDKIHPGDIVRMEFDGDKKTLMFSVNGGPLELGFSEISEDIYPACGSYRNGVGIKLLKVEVFTTLETQESEDYLRDIRPTSDISWVKQETPDIANSSSSSLYFSDPEVFSRSKKDNSGSPESDVSWETARGNRGAYFGVHEWSFELLKGEDEPFSVGIIIGSSNYPYRLATHSPNQEDVSSGKNENIGSSFAWNSDGSLWHNGQKVADDFGILHFPFQELATISMRVNCFDQSLSFFVNGQFVGKAFGLTDAKVGTPVPVPVVKDINMPDFLIYPAASLFTDNTNIRIKSTGVNGSTVIPFSLSFVHNGSCLFSRLCSQLMMGPGIDAAEQTILPWLESPIFLQGVNLRELNAAIFPSMSVSDEDVSEMKGNIGLFDMDHVSDASSSLDPLLLELCSFDSKADGSLVSKFYDWLELLDPEPLALRKAFERSGSYRFPRCELPFTACLIHHGNLLDEAKRIFSELEKGNTIEASPDISLVWQKVKQLRSNLRIKKQKSKSVGTTVGDVPTTISHEAIEISPTDPSIETNSSLTSVESVASNEIKGIKQLGLGDLFHSPGVPDILSLTEIKFSLSVLSVSIDFERKRLFLETKLASEESKADFKSNIESVLLSDITLLLNGVKVSSVALMDLTETASNPKFVLWFDIPKSIDANKLSGMKLIYREDLEGAIMLKINYGSGSGTRTSTDPFEEFCLSIARKARFLLSLNINSIPTNASSKSILLNLSSLYSTGSFGSASIRKPDLSRWRTQERWKRVIDFLHVQSKLKRQISRGADDLDSQVPSLSRIASERATPPVVGEAVDIHNLQQESFDTNSQALIQAFAIFISSEDIHWSTESLYKILFNRLLRSKFRTAALDLMNSFISCPRLGNDVFLAFDTLSIFNNAIPPICDSNTTKISRETKSQGHYLSNLEGCPTKVLKQIQESFANLFKSLTSSMSHFLHIWDKSANETSTSVTSDLQSSSVSIITRSISESHVSIYPIFLILKLWAFNFSSRDFESIQDSGILPIIHKILSLTYYEKIANDWTDSAIDLVNFYSSMPSQFIPKKSLIWSTEKVNTGLASGSMRGRELLLHSYQALKTNSSLKKLDNLSIANISPPLFDDPSTFVKRGSAMMRGIHQALHLISEKEENTKKLQEQEKEAEMKAELDRISKCGIFDSSRCNSLIKLSEKNTVAILRENHSNAVAVFGTLTYTSESLAVTGNYYEVTVYELGEDGDIGIGLASPDHSIEGQMPGWHSHSYGYHGDDGRKFGANGTEGIWPTFEPNDVIGCGFDVTNRRIFYTRNGEYLGIGFENVEETTLCPYVGFANRHNQRLRVKINCGLEPFVFTNNESDIVVLVNSFVEEERKIQSAQALLTQQPEDSVSSAAEEGNANESDLTTKANDYEALYASKISRYNENDGKISEFSKIRQLTSFLSHYLLLLFSKLSCISDEPQESTISPNSASQKIPETLMARKDVSKFGSNKAVMSNVGANLQASIVAAITHDVAVGSKYLRLLTSDRRKNCSVIEDEMLGVDDNSASNERLILEPFEVNEIIYSNLNILAMLAGSSDFVTAELCRAQNLRSILSTLDGQSSYNDTLVLTVVKKILPYLDPKRAEDAIPSHWLTKIQTYEDTLAKLDLQVKSRKLHDSLIKVLLLESSDIFKTYSSSSSADNNQPFGAGNQLFSCGYNRIKLLQSIFEIPAWTELVAINISNALKQAETIFNANLSEGNLFAADEVYSYAIAASHCLSSIPLVSCGSLAEMDQGGLCTIVSCVDTTSSLNIVLHSCLKDFYCTRHVETVDREKVKPLNHSVGIDFSKLSQPFLLQLVSLACLNIKWLISSSFASDAFMIAKEDTLRIRLCGMILNALSYLVTNQTESIVDFIHDAGILADIGLLSSKVNPLDTLISLPRALDLWIFARQRIFEYRKDALTLKTESKSDEGKEVVCGGSESKETAIEAIASNGDETPQPIIEISSAARLQRLEAIEKFSTESGLPLDKATSVLEYSMMNEEFAKSVVAGYNDPSDWSAYNESSADESAAGQVKVSDENVIKNLEYSSDNTMEESSSSQNYCVLSTIVNGDDEFDSVGPYYVCLTSEEGVCSNCYDPIGILRQKDYSDIAVIDFVSPRHKVITSSITNISKVRKVQSFYGYSSTSFNIVMPKIDLTVAILSLRSVSERLISSGCISSIQLFEQSTAVNAFKYIACSTRSNMDQSLTSIFSGLSANLNQRYSDAEVDHSDENLVRTLVLDVESNFNNTCELMLVKKEPPSDSNQFRFSSPHPHPPSHEATGKIIIDDTWRGVTIKFSPNCRTTGKSACLYIYDSQVAYDSQSPKYSFYGSPGDESYFKEVSFSGCKSIFYRFSSGENTIFPSLNIKEVDGKVGHRGNEWFVESSSAAKAVGLGEDDSLFNLFDEKVSADELSSGRVVCDCLGVTEGAWYFEVNILALSGTERSADSTADLEVGFLASSSDAAERICGFDSNGSAFINTNTDKGRISEILSGAWNVGDFVGVLLEVSGDSCSISISTNGNWSSNLSSTILSKSLKPYVNLVGLARVDLNFGERKFQFTPANSVKYQSILQNQELSSLKAKAWGYDFTVHPLTDLNMILSTEYDLVWSPKSDTCSGKIGEPSCKFWVWRSKSSGDFRPAADVITTSPLPPARSIIVDKKQCKPPKSFSCVLFSSKCNLVIWRPIPEEGFISMGDIVVTGSGSFPGSPPASSTCVCVPLWAVKPCEVNNKILTIKKLGEKMPNTASLWRTESEYGFFLGSPYESRNSSEPRAEEFKENGIGAGYELIVNAESLVFSKWKTESHIGMQPSIPWAYGFLKCILQNSKWRVLALTESLFLSIVNYLRSSVAVNPLKFVPILIQLVRIAQEEKVTLPLTEVKNLCNVVLTEAVSIIQSNKKSGIPQSVMTLVDLVVEIQAVQVAETSAKDRWRRLISKAANQSFKIEPMNYVNVTSSEEDPADHSKERDSFSRPTSISQWWEQRVLVPKDLRCQRLISRDSVETLFAKTPMLSKLRQALKFIYAINSVQQEHLFPKLLTTKLWYDHASQCKFIESRHPYKEKGCVTREVHFPGAQSLTVLFDQRCVLSKGDKLVLESGSKTLAIDSVTYESLVKKEVQFSGDRVSVRFEASEDGEKGEVNPSNEWGWGILVTATGRLYESAEVSLDLDKEVSYAFSRPVEELSASIAPLRLIESMRLGNSSQPAKKPARDDDSVSESSSEELSTAAPVTTALVTASLDSSSEHSKAPAAVEADSLVSRSQELKDGISFTEVETLSSTILDEAIDPFSSRPKSKRGRRTDSSGSKQESSESEPKLTGIERDIEIIVQNGRFVKSGAISVPHATEIDLSIERSTPSAGSDDSTSKAEKDEFAYVIIIFNGTNGGDELARFIVGPNSSKSIKVEGYIACYSIWAMKSAEFRSIIKREDDLAAAAAAEEAAAAAALKEAEREAEREAEKLSDSAAAMKSEAAESKGHSSSLEELPSDVEVPGWACNLCTLFNTLDDMICSVCGNPRGDDGGASAAEAAFPASAGWWCPVCTLINPLGENTCSACGSSRIPVDPAASDAKESDDEDAAAAALDSLLAKPSADDVLSTPATTEKAAASSPSGKAFDELKISAKGKLTDAGKFETRLEASLFGGGEAMTPMEFYQRTLSWSKDSDCALLEYINSPSHRNSSAAGALYALPKQFLSYNGITLSQFNVLDIILRSQLFESFNKNLETLLPLIDLGNEDPKSLGALIRKSNRYLLLKTKTPLLDKAISATAYSGSSDVPAGLVLSNFKSLLSRDLGEKDPSTSQNCFVQAFRQLQKRDSNVFCYSSDRVFSITFADESGIDAGGVFREGMSRIMEDLFSDNFNLLVLCPNGQQEVHTSMDKYVPNPIHTGPLALEMFEFVGKLMATSIRAKLCLPFEFPLLVWKKLIGEDVADSDLLELDAITGKQLDEIEFCDQQPLEPIRNQEEFFAKYEGKLKFVYVGAEKEIHEIGSSGSAREVTFENRIEYCKAVRAARLSEFDLQVAAMKEGMSKVVPSRALLLFSATQLEELVCGSPTVDIELWKTHTDNSGLSSTTLNLFWKVMATLSPKDQSGFIRFAWGRSRLPTRREDWTTRMRLSSAGRAVLPVAHTCFFSVEMPEYRTEDEMRHGLLTAIHFGVGGVLMG